MEQISEGAVAVEVEDDAVRRGLQWRTLQGLGREVVVVDEGDGARGVGPGGVQVGGELAGVGRAFEEVGHVADDDGAVGGGGEVVGGNRVDGG